MWECPGCRVLVGRRPERECPACRARLGVKRRCAGPKKHPCPDCRACQWCSDERCRACRKNLCNRTGRKCNKGKASPAT